MTANDTLRHALPGLGLDLADVVDKTVSHAPDVYVSVHRGRSVGKGRSHRDWYARVDLAGRQHWAKGVGVETGPHKNPDLAVADLAHALRQLRNCNTGGGRRLRV